MISLPCTDGYLHEACFYESDDEFLAVAAPFVKNGVNAGEKVLVALPDRQADLLRSALPEAKQITFVAGSQHYLRPAATIRTLLEIFRSHVEQNSGRLRVVGAAFDPLRATWEPWARYEAAVNELFAGYPVWGLCVYDTRITADQVLDEVERTHPYIHSSDGEHLYSAKFEPPRQFLANRPAPAPDPLESTAPHIKLVNPTAGQARRAVFEVTAGSQLAASTVDDLVHGVSEVVTNAHQHGAPPVVLRAWSTAGRTVATVEDCGNGLTDPLLGLQPARPVGEGGGLGLWVTHQICSEVVHCRSPSGFSVRLTVR
ncbi:MAG: sensor histidine kinase [Actinomycetota bacterium]